MSAEVDIEEFLEQVDRITPLLAPELALDWGRLLAKLRTNLAAVQVLVDRGEGYAIEFFDDLRHIIRDKRSGMNVRLFKVLDAFDEFQQEHLVLISPHVAVTRTDAPIGRA